MKKIETSASAVGAQQALAVEPGGSRVGYRKRRGWAYGQPTEGAGDDRAGQQARGRPG